MGDGILTYRKTEDGQFVPLWTESIQKGYEMENSDTKVTVALGYTLNVGNFQSLRIDLGIEDSRRDGENINEAFERVYEFVENKLAEKVKEASSEISQWPSVKNGWLCSQGTLGYITFVMGSSQTLT